MGRRECAQIGASRFLIETRVKRTKKPKTKSGEEHSKAFKIKVDTEVPPEMTPLFSLIYIYPVPI